MTIPEQKKAIVPRLRFPEFRDAGPWEVKQINQITQNVITGGTPSTTVKEYWGGSIRWMNSGDLNQKRVYEVKGRITEIGLHNSSTKIIPPHCVLVGLAGQGKTRGTVAMNMVDLCINQSIAAIFPNDHVFYRDYIYHNLDSRYDELRDLSAGDGGRGGINLQMLKSFLVPLPSLPEQKKIADCLSSLDDVIELEAKKLEALKTHKKGLMQQLFPREGETTPRLRFPEFRDAGPWEVKKIGDLFSITRGKVLPMNLISDSPSLEKPYPVYSSQTKNNGLAGYYSEYLFENAITWTTDGANAGDVNYRKGKFYCTNVCGVLLSDEGYANNFVAELLNTVTRKHVSYVGNPKLMNGVMAQIEIPIPSVPEQQKIADCLSSLDDVIELEAKKLEALKAHKKGLMQQLFPQEISA